MGQDKMMSGLLVSMITLVLGVSGCTSQLHSAVIGENEALKRNPSKAVATVHEDTLPLTTLHGNPIDSEIEPIHKFLGESPAFPNITQGEGAGEFFDGSQPSSSQSVFANSPDSNSQSLASGSGSQNIDGHSGKNPLSGSNDFFASNADSLSEGTSDLTSPSGDDVRGNEGFVNSSNSMDTQATPFGGRDIVTGLVGEDFVERLQEATSDSEQKEIADIFFDFDQARIQEDARSVLETNAELLTTRYEGAGLLIEGHCDEWGTAEYNLVLGQRRAEVAKRYLVDLGVSSSKMETVSYGKERPFCARSNSQCWERNRRSHFVVKQHLTPNDFR